MALKSLKATISIQSGSLDDAIVFLSQRFLRATATGCRVVQTPTEVCAADVCQPLIDRWMTGRVAYSKGKVVLVFRSGKLALEADMLIYTPKDGDRFLYTKPRPDRPSPPIASASAPGSSDLPTANPLASEVNATLLQDMPRLLDRVQSQVQTLATKLDQFLVAPPSGSSPPPLPDDNLMPPDADQLQAFANILMRQVHQQTNQQLSDQISQQMGAQLGDYLTHYLSTQVHQQVGQVVAQVMQQQMGQQVAIALEPVVQQLDNLQDQIETLTDYVAELDVADFDESPPAPQTDEDWLERINATWGTVGDYEKYSFSYRDANAETPLQETPDWVALCEFDWIWELCPTLATLYELIRGTGGIGDEGADILQQFGQHIDSKTGNAYYIYQLSGYSALDALRQIAHNPDHSWLPELKRLWSLLADAAHPIFQLFGWETEAIAALQQIVSPHPGYNTAYGANSSTPNSSTPNSSTYDADYQTSATPTLHDYQARLNLGPFTPITPDTIKRAYRQAMKAAHPDAGGSTEYAQQVNEAYAAVLNHYFPEAAN